MYYPSLILLSCFGLLISCPVFGQLVRQANTSLDLPSSLPSVTSFTTQNALGSMTFAAPIGVAVPPGETDRLFVVERGGSIQLVSNLSGTPTKSLFLNLADYLTSTVQGTLAQSGENGLLSMAFHPNYAENGYFFVFYSLTTTGPTRTFQRIARFRVSNGNPNVADPTSHTPFISQLDEASNHNGGKLAFGHDGYLYIGTGDEGGQNDQYDNARFINKDFFSAILRIDVDKKPGSLPPNAHTQNATAFPSAVHAGAYTIPADNPFIGATTHNGESINPNTVRTEVYAAGFRNPWQFSFDEPTGRLFVADVGQNAREEINIVVKGGDYGWSYYEGTLTGPRFSSRPQGVTYQAPIYDYARGNGTFQGNSVTGGVVYRGQRFTGLYESYIFADYVSGRVWALKENGGIWSPTLLTTDSNIVSFGIDPRDNEPLLIDIVDGTLKRLAASGTSGSNPPALLSQTGAFTDLATLAPANGIVSYEPNVSFWSDYAVKTRWFSIPNINDRMTFSESGNWTFPAGTVWIKHFELEMERGNPATKRRLETRFLVKTGTESYGITYKWRADMSDADLVPETGLDEELEVIVSGEPITQNWRYPSRNECRTCHTPVAGHALSFTTRQLNREHTYGTQTVNQLTALADAGYLTNASIPAPAALPAYAPANDDSQSLEWRVRSYLAVNCISCHQPGGASIGNWDARSTTPMDTAAIINGLLVVIGDSAANRFAVPGDTEHSMVLKRLKAEDGSPRMPPLATNEQDNEAIALLTSWINNDLPDRQSYAQWQALYFIDPNAPGAAPEADPDNDGQSNYLEYLLDSHPIIPSNAFELDFTNNGTQLNLSFTQLANRSVLLEASSDLTNWQIWDAEGNKTFFVPTDTFRTISTTLTDAALFFRVRVMAP